ncbi:LysE family translocator [Gandjariella thermophila]|uniref:Threonine transporter RhtB n=1 Tax=Gandjariella thermophila TaxID=1931992 RepID=A0A4D4J744_9PSEU|nr:LysE family translocator [Gandjariella thermophila]GDY30830.1 threonine transporter RhtB [Gandjariella thermophila]
MDVVSPAFVATCVLVVMSPGPSLAVIIDQTLRAGRPAGLVAVTGNTSGLVFWAFASVLGLTALVRTSELAFLALKIAGAGYLCWLGVQSLRRSRRHGTERARPHAADQTRRHGTAQVWAREREPERGPRRILGAYRAGLLTNLSNPKAAVLYLALFPQFLPAHGGTVGQTAALAVVQMAISATWYTLVVLAVGVVRRLLARPAVRARLDQVTGLVLVGLGIRLATLTRAAV